MDKSTRNQLLRAPFVAALFVVFLPAIGFVLTVYALYVRLRRTRPAGVR